MDKDVVSLVKQRVSLVEIVREHTSLVKRIGSDRYMARCPFHDDRNPSMSVDDTKKLFYCHGCRVGGDVIHFVMKIYGIDFREALERLAVIAGVDLPSHQSGSCSEFRRALELHLIFADYYHRELMNMRDLLEYLKSRGLTDEIIASEKIGFCRGNSVVSSGVLSSDDIKIAEKYGLIQKRFGGEIRETFAQRITFPIRNTKGEIIAFGGRIVGKGSENLAKYVNSKNNALYHKEKNLYLQHRLSLKTETAILVEGYMDALVLTAHGIENVVSPLGTSLTASQASILSNFREVVIVFDGDKGGVSGTVHAFKILMDSSDDLNIKAVFLPQGVDPDEFVLEKGKESFLKELQAAEPAVKAVAGVIANEALRFGGTIRGALKYVESKFELSKRTPLICYEFARSLSPYFGVPVSTIYDEFVYRKWSRTRDGMNRDLSSTEVLTQVLLSAVLSRPDYCKGEPFKSIIMHAKQFIEKDLADIVETIIESPHDDLNLPFEVYTKVAKYVVTQRITQSNTDFITAILTIRSIAKKLQMQAEREFILHLSLVTAEERSALA